MVFHKTVARGLGLMMVLAGCGTSTGVNLVTDGDPELSGLSDEFSDPSSISTWLIRAEVEGDPSDGSVSINGGQLLLRPLSSSYGSAPGWGGTKRTWAPFSPLMRFRRSAFVVLFLLLGSVPVLRADEVDPAVVEARAAVVERIAFLFDAESRPELEQAAAEMEKAQAAAVKRIFDNKRYPTSAQAHRGWRVGVDVQPGHKEMERLVAAALIQHNRFVALLARGLGAKTRLVGARAPTTVQPEIVRPVMSYGITVIDTGIAKFLKAYRTKHDVWVQRSSMLRAVVYTLTPTIRLGNGSCRHPAPRICLQTSANGVIAYLPRKRAFTRSTSRRVEKMTIQRNIAGGQRN